MLNGIDPIIIFQFSKLSSIDSDVILGSIPFVSQIPTVLDQPPIPIYLSEKLTGLCIDREAKSVDIETHTETKSTGETADVKQKGVSSTVTIDLVTNKNSLGIALLSAMIDQIYDKVTSKEYAISYLHGATTVFRGLLQSYSVDQSAEDDRLFIKIQLSRGEAAPEKPEDVVTIPGTTGPTPLGTG